VGLGWSYAILTRCCQVFLLGDHPILTGFADVGTYVIVKRTFEAGCSSWFRDADDIGRAFPHNGEGMEVEHKAIRLRSGFVQSNIPRIFWLRSDGIALIAEHSGFAVKRGNIYDGDFVSVHCGGSLKGLGSP
jgi:hypothetical protein